MTWLSFLKSSNPGEIGYHRKENRYFTCKNALPKGCERLSAHRILKLAHNHFELIKKEKNIETFQEKLKAWSSFSKGGVNRNKCCAIFVLFAQRVRNIFSGIGFKTDAGALLELREKLALYKTPPELDPPGPSQKRQGGASPIDSSQDLYLTIKNNAKNLGETYVKELLGEPPERGSSWGIRFNQFFISFFHEKNPNQEIVDFASLLLKNIDEKKLPSVFGENPRFKPISDEPSKALVSLLFEIGGENLKHACSLFCGVLGKAELKDVNQWVYGLHLIHENFNNPEQPGVWTPLKRELFKASIIHIFKEGEFFLRALENYPKDHRYHEAFLAFASANFVIAFEVENQYPRIAASILKNISYLPKHFLESVKPDQKGVNAILEQNLTQEQKHAFNKWAESHMKEHL